MHFILRHFKVFPHHLSIFETKDMNIQAYIDLSALQYKWTAKKLQDVGDMFWAHRKFQDTSEFEQILDYFCHVAIIILGLLTTIFMTTWARCHLQELKALNRFWGFLVMGFLFGCLFWFVFLVWGFCCHFFFLFNKKY